MKKIALLVFVGLLTMVAQLSAQDMALKTNILYDATTTINLGYEVGLGRKTTLDIWVNYNPWTLGHKWVGLDEEVLPTIAGGVTSESASEREIKLKHFMIQPELRYWLCEKFNGHFFGVHLHGGLFNVGALKLPFGWGRYKEDNGVELGQYSGDDVVGWRDKNSSTVVTVPTMTPVGHSNTKVNGVVYQPNDDGYAYAGMADKDVETHDAYWKNADRDGIYTNSFEGWFIGAGVSYGYHWVLSRRLSMEFTAGLGYAFLKYDKNRCTDCKKKLGEESTHYFGPTRIGISLVYMLK